MVKEVHEIHSESVHLKDQGHNSRESGEIVNAPSNVVGSALPLNSLEVLSFALAP